MKRSTMAELEEMLAERPVELDGALRRIVDEAVHECGADRGTLYLVDRARQELVSRVAQLPELKEIRLRLGEGIAGAVATSGELVNMPSKRSDKRWTPRIDKATGYETRSLLAVPLADDKGRVVGVLQLVNKLRGPFGPADERVSLKLASDIVHLLEVSGLAPQLWHDRAVALDFRFNGVVASSDAMRVALDRIARAAATEASVLLRGESGTGKEVLARAVHWNSARRDGPFVTVDCAALPAQLIDAELFGHEQGAFTGADRARDGLVDAARGGTLFVDELGDLPLDVQGKLLRLVQERTFSRVGSRAVQKADLRLVFATHRDLESDVRSGRFRQDLYYRVRVVEVTVPPLRDRGPEDLDRLIDHFLFRLSRRHGRPGLAISDAARARLHSHRWPGNVRELEHCVEAAVVLAHGDAIQPEELGAFPAPSSPTANDRTLEAVEAQHIHDVLASVEGNRSRAAEILGIGRNTLARKLART